MMPGQFVDGRIAFLKAQLKITPAQEGQWQKVEAAMRENAKALDQTIATARQNRGDRNAVERLEMREQFVKVRSENSGRLRLVQASLRQPVARAAANGRPADRRRRHRWHQRA